jgi:hypothetical protein
VLDLHKSRLLVAVVATDAWQAIPTNRGDTATAFSGIDDVDILMKGLHVLLRPITRTSGNG